MSFLDTYSTFESLPIIINIMGKYMNWDENKKSIEYKNSIKYLKTMVRYLS